MNVLKIDIMLILNVTLFNIDICCFSLCLPFCVKIGNLLNNPAPANTVLLISKSTSPAYISVPSADTNSYLSIRLRRYISINLIL